MMFLSVLALTAGTTYAASGLGDGLWRTFAHQTALPTTTADAENAGWTAVSACDANLGVLYTQDSSGPSEKHPLGLRFTNAGQIAGVQTTVYGSNKKGNAAPQNLVDKGFWKASNATETWHMDISFRSSSAMCSDAAETELIGDRVVINQDSLKYNIPLTQKEANAQKFSPGSCMASMGWHHFMDLSTAPEQSFVEDQLMPIVPMYNPPDETGKLNAFFFASPVAQPGSGAKYLLNGKADWESPALTSSLMCQNWCDDNCHWDESWATMHIYVSSEYKSLTCPNGHGPVGQSCDF